MTDDWRARAVPNVIRNASWDGYGWPPGTNPKLDAPAPITPPYRRPLSTRPPYAFSDDASDYERPARIIAPSVPEGVAWRLRGLQRLVEAAPVADWTIEAVIPSAANLREHHMTRATRAKKARKAAFDSVPYALRNSMDATLLPAKHSALVVLMVRQAPRAIDSDNCAAALKAWRDGIADAFGIDDRDKRVQWETEQCKCSIPSLRVYVVSR